MFCGTARVVSTGVALAAAAWFAPNLAHSPDPARGAAPESVLFESMRATQAATLHTQTLAEAPASITIIPAGDIGNFRTLGEAPAAGCALFLPGACYTCLRYASAIRGEEDFSVLQWNP